MSPPLQAAKWSEVLPIIEELQPKRLSYKCGSNFGMPCTGVSYTPECTAHAVLKGVPQSTRLGRLVPSLWEMQPGYPERRTQSALECWCRSPEGPAYTLSQPGDISQPKEDDWYFDRNDGNLEFVQHNDLQIHLFSPHEVNTCPPCDHDFEGRIRTFQCSLPGEEYLACEILVDVRCHYNLSSRFHPHYLQAILREQAEPPLLCVKYTEWSSGKIDWLLSAPCGFPFERKNRKYNTLWWDRRWAFGRGPPVEWYRRPLCPSISGLVLEYDENCTWAPGAADVLLGVYTPNEIRTIPVSFGGRHLDFRCPFIVINEESVPYHVYDAASLLGDKVNLFLVGEATRYIFGWRLDVFQDAYQDARRKNPKNPVSVNGVTALYLRLFGSRFKQAALYGCEWNGDLVFFRIIAQDFRHNRLLPAVVDFYDAGRMIKRALLFCCDSGRRTNIRDIKACRDLFVAYLTGDFDLRLPIAYLDDIVLRCLKTLDNCFFPPWHELNAFESSNILLLARRTALVYVTVLALILEAYKADSKLTDLMVTLTAAALNAAAHGAAVAGGVASAAFGVPFVKEGIQITAGAGTMALSRWLTTKPRRREEALQKVLFDLITAFGYQLDDALNGKIHSLPSGHVLTDQEISLFADTALSDFSQLALDEGVHNVETTLRHVFVKPLQHHMRIRQQVPGTAFPPAQTQPDNPAASASLNLNL